MDFALTPDQEALRDGVRKLCEGRVTIDRVRAAADVPGAVDVGLWHELGEAGVFTLTVNEAGGGAGLGSPEAALVFEQLGRSLAPGPLVWTHLAAGLVDGAATGDTVVAGVDGRHAAHAEGVGKPVLVEHLDAAGALVMLTDDAVYAFDATRIHGKLARATDPLTPVSRVDAVALRASAGALVSASAVGLRRTATVLTASLLLGIAGAATDAAVAYAKEREQFDRPIGSFQAIKHILADMFLRTEVARAAVYAAAVTNDDATVGDADVAAAVAKLLAAEAAIANAKANVQVHGGMGFTWDVDAHLYLKRAWALQHAFGTIEEHADAVAWSLVGAPVAPDGDGIAPAGVPEMTGRQMRHTKVVPVSATPSSMVAIDGRPLGRRAQQTRQRLLEATQERLERQGIRDLRVVDIAREVGTSPATFYQYFRDVEEAVLVLAETLAEELHPLTELLDTPWSGKAGLESARGLIDGFITYWDRNRAVLRVRNLAAQEGDERFRAVRIRTLSEITDRLADKIANGQSAGRVADDITPYAAAAALVAMMERMAAYHFDLEPRGIKRRDLVETLARILLQTVTGRKS